MFGYGATDRYFIMPRDGLTPWGDSKCRFETADGLLYGPEVDAGTLTFPKFLHGLMMVVQEAAPAHTVRLAYQIDGGSYEELIAASSDGTHEGRSLTSTQYNVISYRVTIETGASTASAVVKGILIDSTPNPPRRKTWTQTFKLTQRRNAEGTGSRESYLLDGVGQVADYVDYWNTKHIVKVLTVIPQGYQVVGAGAGRTVTATYAVELVEV